MSSKIDIASNALIMIGDNAINSFTDSGAGALAASNLYEPAYEAMLAEHRWTFAQAQYSLSRLVAPPDNSWQYQFQIPTGIDLIGVFGVYPDRPYDIFEDKVYSDNETVEVFYIKKVDESMLSPAFVIALQLRLAAQFAVFISDDNTLANLYSEQAYEALNVAKNIDSQSRTTQRIKSSPFIDVR